MFKLPKPAATGVALALSCFLGLGAFASRAEALAVVILSPPEQAKPSAPTPTRMAQIANYDVIVFIDSSRSMSCTISPETRWVEHPRYQLPEGVVPGQSKWQWCAEQTEKLSKQLDSSFQNRADDHLKVVMFSDKSKEYKDVDMSSVPTFFADNHPVGKTNADEALRIQLKEYFAKRDHNKEAVRPLLVAFITDGAPDDPFGLRQTIIDATKKMQNQDEVAITFLQVGIDPKASRYLHELDSDLVKSSSAKYDIVTTKSFNQVNESGLAVALLDAVHK